MTYDEWATKWGVAPRCGGGVGDGWVPILEALAQELATLGFDFSTVAQVKEKFGGLRFYVDGFETPVEEAIDRAEAKSFKTCEDCGTPGKRRPGGWIRTLCDGCAR